MHNPEVYEETEVPRILRVRGPVLCYEVVSESLEPVERFNHFGDAKKYLELLMKHEEFKAAVELDANGL